SQLRTQLCALLAENQKQISLEVNLAFARRWTAIEQLRIADESIASLQQSLEDIEQLRAIEPVNMERFLELEQRLMAAESQRVTAVIEQAKSELDLAKAIGSLAERHQ
ncbi:MAG: TolC family protein, partial [Planctomycetota bacterium]